MTAYLPYHEILARENGKPHYSDLLLTIEWNNKRAAILDRDHYCCSVCHKGETILWLHFETGVSMPHEVEIPQHWQSRTVFFVNEEGLQSFKIYDPRPVIYCVANQHRRMHVHHRLYIYGSLPWQYADAELVTMCESCHFNWHQ